MKRGISGNVHSFPGSLFAFRQGVLFASVWEDLSLRKWQECEAFLIKNTPANPGERNNPIITGDDRVIE